ncbi:flagellar hook-basal body complex protein FliE [Enterococcus saccharolyticus]|uniref:Flagellar hook-basal body complex protein FliE n=1 Tax=Candidatus Enterococcus willemsii TaxID=1857215 RepID=A0ABQ6YWT2_9ENTE|nr:MULTISPECIES: flagellar hook-basal body complex protein FliE [Enterococcus]KAF1302007.1 flagellar hook-basal body complex protein FliE [Enterococcus sp. CU12B]MCD5002887.1 flagellar hook-basal body complex protein FliE [Enterococcus saccharolyticus]
MNTISYAQSLLDYQKQIQELQATNTPQITPQVNETEKSFSSHLGEAIAGLSQNMQIIDADTTRVISGDENDLAKVMTNMTEAQLSLQTAVQVRNKCLEAYNDIKNMQF